MQTPENIPTSAGTVVRSFFKPSYLLFAVGVMAVILLPLIFTTRYSVNLLILASTYGIATLGLTVLLGYSGQISLAQAVFYGIGAYTIGLGTTHFGLNWWVALLMGMSLAALFGLVLGFTTMKVGGHYLAMVTICVQIIFTLVLMNWRGLTGGPDGIAGIPRPSFFVPMTSAQSYAWFSLTVLLLAIIFVWILRDRRLGLAMRAVRENEIAAESLGVNTVQVKITTFVICAVLGALGGGLYASGFSYISPDSFSFEQSVEFLAMGLVGGIDSSIGSVLGASLLVFLPEWLRQLQNIYLVIYGGIIIFVIVFMPDGLWGYVNLLTRKFIRPQQLSPARQPLSMEPAATDEVLAVIGLGKHFGGVKALDGVDFVVRRGEIHALIGPNGSGKSTCINVVTGIYKETFGNVKFLGGEITGKRPSEIAKLGLARTFQNLRLFKELTVWENVIVGSQRAEGSLEDVRDRAMAAIEFVGLQERVHEQCKNLAYGHQKLVELARTIAGKPQVLLLDEPAAGLNQSEKQDLVALLKRLHQMGLTMVLVEHDMSLVAQLSTEATVLNFGKRIAAGSMEEVLDNPKVIEAYLGNKEVALGA